MCVNISESIKYVAIIKHNNQCAILNESNSDFGEPQQILKIKEGYCQNQNAEIVKGIPGRQFNDYFLCVNLAKRYSEYYFDQDYCLEILTRKKQKLSKVSGKTIDGFCVNQNEYHEQKVICKKQFCEHMNKNQQYTCFDYNFHSVIGITEKNQCIFDEQFFEVQIQCKQQYCRQILDNRANCIKISSTQEVLKNGDCVQGEKEKRNLEDDRYNKNDNINPQTQCTQQNKCFDDDQNQCVALGSSPNRLAKLQNNNCAGLNVMNSIACYNDPPACLSYSGGVCLMVSFSNPQSVGQRQNGQCAQLNTIYRDLSSCYQSICLTQFGNVQNQLCVPFYGSSYLFMTFYCNNVSQKAQYCQDPTGQICYDPNSQQCYQTTSFGGNGLACQQNGTCQTLTNYLFIGRAQSNYQCLQNYQQPTNPLDICFQDPQNVCKVISSVQFCVIYPQSSQYLGFVSENGSCAVLNQVTLYKGYIADLINLRSNYCQDSDGYIRQLDYSLNIGVDSYKYQCLQQDQVSQGTIIQCQVGFCIKWNTCQIYNSIFIGKNAWHQCLQEGQTISIECNFNDNNVCHDTVAQSCNHLSDVIPNRQGKVSDGSCASGGLFYPKIIKCSQNFCIQKQNSNPNSQEGCFSFDLNSNRVGVDANGYCIQMDQNNAVRCMKGQVCLDQQNGNSCCTALVMSKTLNKYARQQTTSYCLPYLDPNGQGDQIETCVLGTCLYQDLGSNQDYCVTQGTISKGNLIVGVDVQQLCVSQDQITSNTILTCYGLNYCILQVDIGQQKCEQLQDFDPNYPNMVYRAKNSNQQCQDLNTPNSIGCMDGLYCLNTQNNNQCQVMSDPSQLNMIGRDLTTQKCIPQNQPIASKCQQDFCIYQGMCVPLSNYYPGKENKTHLCLQQSSVGQYGASNCFKDRYCMEENSDGLFSCNKLDFSNPDRVGIEKDTLKCIKQDQPIAVMCAIEKYCLNIKTHTCQFIDLNQGMCVDINGVCALNGSCKTCDIDQCLSPDSSNTCLNLVQPSVTYCIDQNGVCAPLNNQKCVFCPDGYCNIYNNGNCVNGTQLLDLLVGNSCFTQLKNQNNKCIQQSVDNLDSDGNMLCLNSSGMCSQLSQNSNKCLLCPKYYVNPGDDKCYSLDEISALQPINPQQLYFNMQLTYVKLDCYDNQFCLKDITKKCPIGCFSCSTETFCTQCIQGYFLYQISSKQQSCVKCNTDIYQYTQVQQYYKNIPTYSCLDCSSEYGLWNETKNNYKTCQNYIVYYDQNTQIVASPLKTSNFQVQLVSDSYKLISYQPNSCTNQCSSCIQSSQNTVICTQCNIGYVLYNGLCQICPNNCQYCQYATFITGYAQLITEINYEQNLSQYYNFILICLQCQQKYVVSYDLQKCQQCGNYCLSCQYENENSVLNLKKSNLRILDFNDFSQMKYIQKCTRCLNGYFLSYDGKTCVQNMQNCDYSSQKVVYGSQQYDLTEQLWTYTNTNVFNYSTKICKQCSKNYIASVDLTSCMIGCVANSSQQKCTSCITNSSYNVICNFCSKGSVLDKSNNQAKCQDSICQQNISGCAECYSYLDTLSNMSIYQCTSCQDTYSIPSINGCLKCPDGCSKCYEGTRTFNYTSILVFNRPFLNIQDRLNYNTTSTNYQLICTECQQGYQFDQQLKLCVKLNCGKYCLQCALINNQPQCIQCNYDLLASLIKNQLYFIGTFYYQSIQDFNVKSMVSLTSTGNDCQLCPLMCETCVNNEDLSFNPFYMYNAQCLSCKSTLPSSKILKNYRITFDKERRKCFLCENGEQGCFFKKQQTIYIQCLDINSRKGDGSFSNPINFNRLNEIEIDQIILNEIDYDQAIVIYNELQVKQLEVQLIFLGDFCVEQRPQNFTTKLKEQIRSLETTALKITCQTSVPGKLMKFQQNNIFDISGFNQVQINNIQFVQQLTNSQLGLIVDDINLNLFTLTNCQFSQLLSLQNSLLLKQYLTLQLSTLNQANLVLEQVQFENIYIEAKQQLIQTKSINNKDSSLNVTFSLVTFTDVYLDQSSLIQLNIIAIQLNIQNLTFLLSKFDNKAIAFDIQPNYITTQQVNIFISNMTIQQTQIFKGSQIINSNFLNSMTINNFTLIQNTLSQMQSQVTPLLISNTFNLSGLNIIKNTIKNYFFFEQQDSLLKSMNFIQYSIFEGITILENQFSSNNYVFFHFKTQVNSNTQIRSMKLLKNKFQADQTPIAIYLESINTIQISDVLMQDNLSFLLLLVESAVNVLISKIVLTQTQNELITPQICQLNQIINYINIDNIQQQNINIFKSIIKIETSQTCINNNQFLYNNKYPQGIFLNQIQSHSVNLLYSQNTQNTSPISIFSKQQINVQISNLNFSDFTAIIQTNQKLLGQISLGFYFQAPTIRAIFSKSNFTNLGSNNPFNWIQGQVKQMEFYNCLFDNQISLSQQNYQNLKIQKNGGFITLQSEYLMVKNSIFSNGMASSGGSIYWTSQNQAQLYIQNTTFSNNIAYCSDDLESQGGAIYIDGQLSFNLNILILQSLFKSNIASYKGAAIQVKTTVMPRSVVQIEAVIFDNNYSLQGSNLNIDSQLIGKTVVIMKNVTVYSQIEIIANQFQSLFPIISSSVQGLIQNSIKALFVFQSSYEISIENSKFRIYCIDITQINQKLINDQIFQKIIFVQNTQSYQEFNNTYYQSVFLNNLIYIAQATRMSIISNIIMNNKNINNIINIASQKSQEQSLAYYNSQICSINFLNVNNNICNSCTNGIIQINSQSLQVQHSVFGNNLAQFGGGLYFQQSQNINQINQLQNSIKNSIFNNNKALISGGSIYIVNSSILIKESSFQNNIAQQSGGAIYLQNDDIMLNQLLLQKNYFVENYSQYGGAIASKNGQSVSQNYNNTFIQNKAYQQGQNIQTTPSSFHVYINKTLQYFQDSSLIQIKIDNHTGGYIQDDIVLKFYSGLNEEIIKIPEDVTLNVKIIKGEGYIKSNKIQQQNGVFILNKQIQVYGIMGQQLVLSITSDLIQIPKYNSSNFLVGYDKNYQLLLNVQIAQDCPIGQVKRYIQDKFNFCVSCIDTYSFTYSDTCFKCPNTEVKCMGNQIFLTSNYWRVSQRSSEIYNCQNCLGDYQLNQQEIQIQKQRLIVNDLNYYCQMGYVGALCEDCDITGKYWGNSYYMSIYKKCQKCSEIQASDLLYPFCFTLAAIVILICITHKYRRQIENNLLYRACQIMFQKQVFYFRQNPTNTVKLLFFQLFVIGIALYYDNNTPKILSSVLVDIGNLFTSQIRISDCLLAKLFQTNFLIKNFIFYFSAWIFVFLCFIVACFFKKICFKQRFWISELFLGLWILVYNSQNAMLTKILRLFKCQTFDNQSFVTDYLSFYCDEFQLKILYYVHAPAYFITLLIPLGFLIFKLNQMRLCLNGFENKVVYEYFTKEYKEKFFFWDIVKLIYKIILGIIQAFSYQITSLQPVLSIVATLAYSFLLFLCKPYEKEKLNQIEINIQYSTAILFCLVNIDLGDNQIIYYTFYGVKSTIISCILYQILIKSNTNMKYYYINFIEKVQKSSKIISLVINKLRLNQPLIKYQKCKQNWYKIKLIIFAKRDALEYLFIKLNENQDQKLIMQAYLQQNFVKSKKTINIKTTKLSSLTEIKSFT
ncbi:transmembrane protein, putative (macronuclear) [Tetrahymena thermophila SB210]|uniref:Transmembrane protein, putative n=1 Tax=Tetrahymena thermophila (strain SB210) TaxID=312017 RepID=W7XLP1_TETTS|nr:transmembrane protein, putative [Tetrahymena thermophila SB210]EWS76629.1 transmembrane protein, putative [Tetrahymena thermophila SB210]|eukprot:XP_012650797.1 transmembrane protein, putative [Tetrahymena thermophila SB210]